MGSCMGRCLPKNDSSGCYRNQSIFRDDNEFHSLVEESESTTVSESKRSSFLSRLLSHKKRKCKNVKKPVLELVEGFWTTNTQSSCYSRLNKSVSRKLPNSNVQARNEIPLQCLDVRALISKNGGLTTSSTPVSSLDLEWEHETLPVSMQDPSLSSWAVVPEENLPELSASETHHVGPSSASDWSRVSSADSLEWDPVQTPLRYTPSGSELDVDTQQLLNEIERLTDQALRETGSGLTS